MTPSSYEPNQHTSAAQQLGIPEVKAVAAAEAVLPITATILKAQYASLGVELTVPVF